MYGGGKKCGRCNKSVYTNEEMIAAGKSWHKRGCFTCEECNKSLDSTTCNDKMSDDGEGNTLKINKKKGFW